MLPTRFSQTRKNRIILITHGQSKTYIIWLDACAVRFCITNASNFAIMIFTGILQMKKRSIEMKEGKNIERSKISTWKPRFNIQMIDSNWKESFHRWNGFFPLKSIGGKFARNEYVSKGVQSVLMSLQNLHSCVQHLECYCCYLHGSYTFADLHRLISICIYLCGMKPLAWIFFPQTM